MTHHILIVDDDSRILKLLKSFFTQNNYFVTTTQTPDAVMDLMQEMEFDLIILDVMMPGLYGTELTKQIRKQNLYIPIIMLTALSQQDEVIEGLSCGASDYLVKPFDPREILIRAQNLINTHDLYKTSQNNIQFGPNQYNTTSKTLSRNNQEIKLSTANATLLDILVQSLNKPISREEISQKLGGMNLRSIDVQIVRLRNKIENCPKNPKHLKTVRNQGYAIYT